MFEIFITFLYLPNNIYISSARGKNVTSPHLKLIFMTTTVIRFEFLINVPYLFHNLARRCSFIGDYQRVEVMGTGVRDTLDCCDSLLVSHTNSSVYLYLINWYGSPIDIIGVTIDFIYSTFHIKKWRWS